MATSTTSQATSLSLASEMMDHVDHKGAMKSVRFPAWTTLMALSMICLIATVSTASPPERRSGAEKWAIAVCSLSFISATIGTVAYLVQRSIFLGTILEISLVTFLLVLWGAGLPAIMNPIYGIAVQGTQVSNANVYFFSWACFAACAYMSASLLQELRGIDLVAQTQPKTMKWFTLLCCGLIVMGNGTRIYKAGQCGSSLLTGSFCRRTKWAIAIGVMTFFSSFCMILLARVLAIVQIFMETIVSFVLVVMWCFGVAYITFGISPGHAIGNMYFASWISFVISIILCSDCVREYLDARAIAASPTTNGSNDVEEVSDPELYNAKATSTTRRTQQQQQSSNDDFNDLNLTEQ